MEHLQLRRIEMLSTVSDECISRVCTDRTTLPSRLLLAESEGKMELDDA
jgi:hypothetical protein